MSYSYVWFTKIITITTSTAEYVENSKHNSEN